jgi:hypothetical protein
MLCLLHDSYHNTEAPTSCNHSLNSKVPVDQMLVHYVRACKEVDVLNIGELPVPL